MKLIHLCTSALLIGVAPLMAQQSQASIDKVLTKVEDVALPGPPVRFDYQSFDPESGRLYIAHMNADQLVVYGTAEHRVLANLDGFKRVHGVTIAPELHRVYASVTGDHQVAAVETRTLKTISLAGPINYPDGLAYAPKQDKCSFRTSMGE